MKEYHGRYHRLDEIRGVTLISMILYHGCWDAVYLLGCDWTWYHSEAAYIWQQSIAWTFILLSGFCWQLGKRRLRRGLTVFGAGLLVTAVTVAVTPQSRIVFGVLTLIGSSMLLMIPLDRVFRKICGAGGMDGKGSPQFLYFGACIGLAVSGALFFLTRNVNRGWLGFERLNIVQLPEAWYSNGLTTWLGFPEPGFFSTDYFSLIPWFFLFLCGYFLFGVAERSGALERMGRRLAADGNGAAAARKSVRNQDAASQRAPLHDEDARPEPQRAPLHKKIMAPIRWMGRHSLLVYLLHQPALYGLAMAVQLLVG